MRRLTHWLPTLAALLLIVTVSQASNPSVLPPNSRPHGHTYGEWQVAWWQWLLSAPNDVSPGWDLTGENVDYGQSGHVWFLAGSWYPEVERTATVPSGTMLFVAFMPWESSALEGYGDTLEELQQHAAMIADGVQNLTFTIDGRDVENLEDYRVQSPGLFGFTLPDDNVFQFFGFDAPAGYYYPAFADGYCLMIAPLSAGTHTLHFTGENPLAGATQDITFHLTVEGGAKSAETTATWSAVKALFE